MSSSKQATLYPPPPIDFALAPVEHPLLVTRIQSEQKDLFTNTYPLWQPPPGQAVFGGTLIGQSLSAAQHTVPFPFVAHSMHCSFHAAPDASHPVIYHVERVNDRRSFVSREVKARQNGRAFFSAVCSFTLPVAGDKDTLLHQVEMPQVERPAEGAKCERKSESEFAREIIRAGFLTFAGPKTTREHVDPFEWVYLPASTPITPSPSSNRLRAWARTRGCLSPVLTPPTDAHNPNYAILGFLTDSWFLSSFHELNPGAAGTHAENISFMTTLNHTIWFHDPIARTDEWMLVERGSSWAERGRVLLEQRIWGADGKLVATCLQEGVVRLKSKLKDNEGKKQKL